MTLYAYLDRRGYCEECGAGWYISNSGTLEGCENPTCEFWASPQELDD